MSRRGRRIRDTEGRPQVVPLYAADRAEGLVYSTELDDLEHALDLEAVRVVREPNPDRRGRRGIIDADLIETYLSAHDASKWHVVLCGPRR
jgi:NAD(P)H-flavin reductase